MPDRILRDELLESERWLDLPSDTDRLAFVVLLLKVDDFGNVEGGVRRVYGWFRTVTQVKTEEGTATTLLHLTEADLVRGYFVSGRPFLHVPRLRPHRQYLVRKVPGSPWDYERKLGKLLRVETRGLAKSHELGEDIQASAANVVTTSQPYGNDVAQGVGVGVGVGVGIGERRLVAAADGTRTLKRSTATRLPDDWHIPEEWIAVGLAVHPDWTRAGIIRESLTFRDYWTAKAGKDATKLKWLATWRNWIRRASAEPVR